MAISQRQYIRWLKQRQIPLSCALIAIGISLPGIAYGLAVLWVNLYHDLNEGTHQDLMVVAMLAWLIASVAGLAMAIFGLVYLIMGLIEKARRN
ncbi:MAG: hypothetical protein ACX94C_01740 [Phycisphaerales bacterium]